MNRLPIPRAILTAVTVVTLTACAAQTPEERVAALRADYQVSLNSFQVLEEPVERATAAADEMGDEAGETAEGVRVPALPEATEEATTPPVDVRQDVLLDIVVRNRSDDRLPGLTLDVEQVDAAEQPKATYRVYLDTSTIGPGAERALSHRLEDVDFTTGDGFHVEVRQAILPEQRSDYREFSEVAEQP